MKVLKKLAGQTAIYGFSSILGRVINFGLTPFYTAIFEPSNYGIIGNLLSYVAFINVFLTFGMETSFFRFTKKAHTSWAAYNHAYFVISCLSGSFLVIGLLSYGLFAGLIGYEEQSYLVAMVVGIIFLDVMAALPMSRLRYEEKAVRFSVINLVNIGITIGANVFFYVILKKEDVQYVFISNLLASASKLLLVLPGTFPKNVTLRPQNISLMVSYGFYIMLAGLAGMMNETLDRILIPFLWPDGQVWHGVERTGTEMVGIYAANYKLGILILLVTQAFRYAAEPFFFKTAEEKDSPKTFAMIFHYFMLASLGGFLILASFAKEIASINLFGLATLIDSRYWEGLNIVPIILMAYVFSAAYTNISIWFKITKQTRFAVLLSGTGAFITILLNVSLIPVIGYEASAWATLASYSVMSIMVYRLGQKYYPIPYQINRLILYGVIVLIGFLINAGIGPSDGFIGIFLTKLLIVGGVGAIIYYLETTWPAFELPKTNKSTE